MPQYLPPDRQSGGDVPQASSPKPLALSGGADQTKNQTNALQGVMMVPAELIYAVAHWGALPEAIQVAVSAVLRAASSQ